MAEQLIAGRVKSLKCDHCGHAMDPAEFRPLSLAACPACEGPVHVPAVFDDFELLELLGKGTSGNVYRAFNPTLQRYVAIKILARQGADASLAEACLAEARALAKLNHPNVIRVYTIGSFQDQHFITMELVNGGTAQKYLKPNYQLDELGVLDFGIKVARGLDAANEAGLVHMDVKPGNILITQDPETPKLIDFGAAQFVSSIPDESKMVGTPYYVAPEVVRGKQPDFKADLYSLGATMYHLMTGRPPFEGKDSLKVVKQRLVADAPSMLAKCDHVHIETDEVVSWMLQRDPSNRYDSYGDLIEALENVRHAIEHDPLGRERTDWNDQLSDQAISSQVISRHFGDQAEVSATGSSGLAGLSASVSQAGRSIEVGEVEQEPAAAPVGLIVTAILGVAALAGIGLVLAFGGGSDDPVDPVSPIVAGVPSGGAQPAPGPKPPTVKPPDPQGPAPVAKPTPGPGKAVAPNRIPTPRTAPKLVAAWPLGADTKPTAGAELSPKVNGSPTPTNDGVSTAHRFGDGAYLEAAGPKDIAGNRSFSLLMRVRPEGAEKRAVFEFGKDKPGGGFAMTVENREAVFQVSGHKPLKIHLGADDKKARHVGILFDASGSVMVGFLNGKQAGQVFLDKPLNLDPSGGIRIGRSGNSALAPYAGTLADVRLYNHPVSVSQIFQLATGKSNIPESKEPVGHWTLADGGDDKSASKLQGEVVGSPSFTADGDGYAQMDVRSSPGFIRAALPKQLVGNRSFTLAANLWPAKQASAVWAVDFGDRDTDNRGFGIQLEPGGMVRIGFAGSGRFVRLDLSAYVGRRIHITAVSDAAKEQLKVYLGGWEKATTPLTLRYDTDNEKGLRIGGGPEAEAFKGMVGDVRLYDRALAFKEIRDLNKSKAKPQAKPVATKTATVIPAGDKAPMHAWTFESGLVDVIGGLSTQAVGAAKVVDDPERGKVLELDGNNSYLKLGGGFEDFTGGLTMVAWVKPAEFRNNARVFEFSNNRWNQNVSLSLGGSGTMGFTNFESVGASAGNPGPYSAAAPKICDLNQWQHVAVVMNTARKVTFYHNGQDVGGGTVINMPIKRQRGQNYIGVTSWSLHYKKYTEIFKGRMDDLMVFKRSLEADEIADLVSAVRTVKLEPDEATLEGATVAQSVRHSTAPGYIQFNSAGAGSAAWDAKVGGDGVYQLMVRYAMGDPKAKTESLILEVDGAPVGDPIVLPSHGNPDQTWLRIKRDVQLAKGTRRVVLKASSGAPRIDWAYLRPTGK